MTNEFAGRLRQLRRHTGWSLENLATAVHHHRGYVGNVESGKRLPQSRRFAELADAALGAAGELVSAWETAKARDDEQARIQRTTAVSVQESERLAALAVPDTDLGEVEAAVYHTVVHYRTPPAAALQQASTLRKTVIGRLDKGGADQKGLCLAAGRLSGVLAYATLDLGDPGAAMAHTQAAWRCAELAGDNELHAWVRGTQSLLSRFRGDYDRALWYARDGQRYAGAGTSMPRLVCGEAQCLANLGDPKGAHQALNAAEQAREHVNTPDALPGVFGFTEAKQHYYSGSSLIWLNGGEHARRAIAGADQALHLWGGGEAHRYPLDDAALAHVYAATAYVQLGDLEAAHSYLQPVLTLPEQRRISWIGKRLGRVQRMLNDPYYQGSTLTGQLRAEIAEYTGQ